MRRRTCTGHHAAGDGAYVRVFPWVRRAVAVPPELASAPGKKKNGKFLVAAALAQKEVSERREARWVCIVLCV